MDNEMDILDMVIDDGDEVVTENSLLDDDILNQEIDSYEEVETIFNTEVYSESVKSDGEKAASHLSRMIEHLLKLAYCTNDRNHNVWTSDAKKHRDIVYNAIWGTKKEYTNLKKYLENNLQKIYKDGLKLYDEAAKSYPDLKPRRNEIPTECKLKLDNLMECSIEYLVAELLKSE